MMVVDHRNVRRALSRLAIPIAASIAGDQFLGIVDTIVIGTLGATSLAALTGATTVFIVFALAMHGFTQGLGILGAQAIGAGENARFGSIVRASVLLPILAAIAIAVLFSFVARPVLHYMVGDLPTLHAGAAYLSLRCISLIPMVLSSAAYTAFGSAGDTRFGMKLLLAINIVHIPLLLVLALGWGTGHPLGILGAGISSLSAEIFGALYSLNAARRRPQYGVLARWEFDVPLALRSARLSLPEAIYLFLVVAPDVAIVTLLAPLGAETISAFRVLMIVSDLTWSIPGSLGTAAQTILGQRFGAGDIDGAKWFDTRARRYGVLGSAICGAIIAVFAWPISFLCTLDTALASLAAVPLVIHMATLPMKGYAMMGIARIRAAGDTRFSMIVGIVASVIVIPGAWLGIHVLHLGLFAVPAAWIIAWAVWCAATALRLRHFDWTTAKLAS
jgi:putative MATE family efflux protein